MEIDENKIDSLPTDELEKLHSQMHDDEGATPPGEPPANDPPPSEVKPVEHQAPPNEHQSSEQQPPAGEPKPGEQATLLAGKYKTSDDLVKGLSEAGKFLKMPDEFVSGAVELARKTGDWSTVEKMYKSLDTQISTQRKAEEKPPIAGPDPTKGTQVPDTKVSDAELNAVVVDEAYKSIEHLPLIAEMREAGFDIPKTQEAWKELKMSHPYYAQKFEQAYLTAYKQIKDELNEVVSVISNADVKNNEVIDNNKKEIKTIAEKYGLALTDEQLQAEIDEAKKSPMAHEVKYGVTVLTPDGIKNHFILKNFEKLADAVKAQTANTATRQTVQDLKKMKDGTIASMSTTGIGGVKKNDSGDPKVETREQAMVLTEEELKKQYEAMRG